MVSAKYLGESYFFFGFNFSVCQHLPCFKTLDHFSFYLSYIFDILFFAFFLSIQNHIFSTTTFFYKNY